MRKNVGFFTKPKYRCFTSAEKKNWRVSFKGKVVTVLNVGERLQKVLMQCLDLKFIKLPIFQRKITKYIAIRVF